MAVFGSTGCKIYIGGQGTLATESGWTEITEVSNLGNFGDAREVVNFLSLSDSRVRKTKGTANAGDISLEFGFDADDAGQTAVRNANDDTGSVAYNFKIELTDAPSTSGATPTTITFKAIVNGYQFQVGQANNTITVASTLSVTTALTITLKSS